MDAAVKGEIYDVTVPSETDQKLPDMANPHNLGTMWVGEDGVWKLLKSLDDEKIERLEKSGNSDDAFNFRKKRKQESIIKEFPELKPVLLELAQIKIENLKKEREVIKKLNDIKSKIKDFDKRYDIEQRLDYAIKNLYSLENQFGYVLPELQMDDDGEYSISKKK